MRVLSQWAAVLFVSATGWVTAGPITDCVGGAPICNGNVYQVSYTWIAGDDYLVDLMIHTDNYTLLHGQLAAFELNLEGIPDADSEGMVPISTPGGSWLASVNGLGASGCTGSPGGAICLALDEAPPPYGFEFTRGDTFGFQFQLTTTGTPTGARAKFLFVDEEGDKVGSDALLHLGITRVPGVCEVNPEQCAPPPPVDAPEPAALALVGLGLMAMAWKRVSAR